MKNKIASVKNHISKHRFYYGVGVGIAASTVVVKKGKEWREFSDENIVPHLTNEEN